MRNKRLWSPTLSAAGAAWLLCAACVIAAGTSCAQAPEAPAVVSGTLKTVRERGTLIIGYRESSVPFSYLSKLREPIGYTIELCKVLANDIAEAVHKALRVQWVPVTPADRIDAVASGKVDIECGSTTNNLERRKRVSFSPTIFIAGTRLMVKKGSGIRDYRGLAGKRVAVTAGTTNEKALRDLAARFKLDLKFLVTRDHDESLAHLREGRADAFATDDVLLYGFIAQQQLRAQMEVVGDFLSYEPYAVMYRLDDAMMARVVNDSFQRMAQTGEITRQYQRWFTQRLPLGVSLDLPMSPQLETIIEATAARSF